MPFNNRFQFNVLPTVPVVATPNTPNPKPQRRSHRENKAAGSDPRYYFNRFFKNYPNFDYDPSLPIMKEFHRMCDLFWPYLPKEEIPSDKKRARKDFRKALVLQFNAIYGCDENNLADWQKLCVVLNLEYIPDELENCRELVASTYVNLVDLVDLPVTQVPARLFRSERLLSAYTKKTGQYFPLESAYAGGLLQFLLRQIKTPGDGLAHPSLHSVCET
ncbi:tyrosinase [Ceratobasidium sp. AG-Ba]|nr:tyrosinase [Ceratobasidium sp. AG-Ba]QRW14328.1 tyrosinase [Ceratobasidium sp. AG-Ba]